MAAKGVYVTLRAGLESEKATLPDNRRMVFGETYLISVDDFQKMSRAVRETIIEVTGIETNGFVVNVYDDQAGAQFLDLSEDGGDEESLDDSGWKVGQVLQGLNGEAFKLCRLVDDDADAGDVVNWSDKTSATVTKDEGEFAGVLAGDITEGEFGWIQTEGIATANAESGVSAGDNLKSQTNGKFETADGDGDTVATALTDTTDDQVEAAIRSTRARNRYVKRPNLFYPGQ